LIPLKYVPLWTMRNFTILKTAFRKYALEEMTLYALSDVDAINVGSRDAGNIREITSLLGKLLD